MTDFFADTYALLAFLNGDEAYARRFRAGTFRTGLLNLVELDVAQRRVGLNDEEIARNLAPFRPVATLPAWDDLKAAARLLAERTNLTPSMSLVDAVGYVQARSLEIPFLSGDAVFDGLPNVERAGRLPRKS